MVAIKNRTSTPSSRAPIRRSRSCWCSAPTPASCTSAPKRSSTPRSTTRTIRSRWCASKATRSPREPSRLVEEAHTIPLFGGRRAVWVKAGGRNFVAAVEAVLASPPADCRIVIEAGDLRRTAPLRALCEKAKFAAVIACYVDSERDLVRLVDDEMREARLAIAPDARAALVSLIGGDRQASRSEIRKLALYAHGKDRVTLDDVLAVVADASALALDAVIDAAFAGKTADARIAIRQGDRRGHRRRHDHVRRAALRRRSLHKARVAFDGGVLGRRDARLHSADSFPPHRARSRRRCGAGPRRGSAARWSSSPRPRSTCAARRRWPRRWRSVRCSTLRWPRGGNSDAHCWHARRHQARRPRVTAAV